MRKFKTIAIDAQVHQDIRIAAAKEGVPIREVAEQSFRLGLAADRLYRDVQAALQHPNAIPLVRKVQAALAAYEASVKGDGTSCS